MKITRIGTEPLAPASARRLSYQVRLRVARQAYADRQAGTAQPDPDEWGWCCPGIVTSQGIQRHLRTQFHVSELYNVRHADLGFRARPMPTTSYLLAWQAYTPPRPRQRRQRR